MPARKSSRKAPSKSVSKIVSAPARRSLDPMTEIAALGRQSLGWDPRVTRLFDANDKKLKEIMSDKANFTPQSPSQIEKVIWQGWEAMEVGALGDPVTRVNTRIVKVTPPQKAAQ